MFAFKKSVRAKGQFRFKFVMINWLAGHLIIGSTLVISFVFYIVKLKTTKDKNRPEVHNLFSKPYIFIDKSPASCHSVSSDYSTPFTLIICHLQMFMLCIKLNYIIMMRHRRVLKGKYLVTYIYVSIIK